ncbi:unnamed protein product, partial [Nesidiocoris tenuis]
SARFWIRWNGSTKGTKIGAAASPPTGPRPRPQRPSRSSSINTKNRKRPFSRPALSPDGRPRRSSSTRREAFSTTIIRRPKPVRKLVSKSSSTSYSARRTKCWSIGRRGRRNSTSASSSCCSRRPPARRWSGSRKPARTTSIRIRPSAPAR